MSRFIPKFFPLLLASWALSAAIYAQDVHFSQYDFNPLYTNAGQTGLFAGDYRLVANHRSQWASVPVPYVSFSASADMRLLKNKLPDDVLGVGLQLIQDKAGDSQLSNSSVRVSFGFSKQLAQGIFLFGGANAGLGQRRFKTDGLRFDDQFQSDQFNPNYNSADLGNLNNSSLRYADIGAGFGIRWQKSRRTWVNLGVGMQHINSPAQSFMGTTARLAARSSLYISASFRLHHRLDFLPSWQLQTQFPYRSNSYGSLFRYHLNQSLGKQTAVFAGCFYRQKDAIIPTVGLNYQGWQLGLSYDINISDFQVATNRNGAMELSLIYIFAKIPPLPTVKICPIL